MNSFLASAADKQPPDITCCVATQVAVTDTSGSQGMSAEVHKAQITDLSKKVAALEKVRDVCTMEISHTHICCKTIVASFLLM